MPKNSEPKKLTQVCAMELQQYTQQSQLLNLCLSAKKH